MVIFVTKFPSSAKQMLDSAISFSGFLLLALFALGSGKEISRTGENVLLQGYYMPQVYSGCGGVVPVTRDYVSRIEYKSGDNYTNNEFCVWVLHLQEGLDSLRIASYSQFEPFWDGLVLYTWEKDTGLDGIQLDNSAYLNISVNGPFFFLAFSSDQLDTRKGFQVALIGSGEPGPTWGSAFFFDQPEGNWSYPAALGKSQYSNCAFLAVVLQAGMNRKGPRKELILRDLNTELEDDVLEIYRLYNYHEEELFTKIGAFSGSQEGIVEAASTSYVYPQVYIFSSDNKVEGKGFTLQWKNALF